jgi:hypothetical protein
MDQGVLAMNAEERMKRADAEYQALCAVARAARELVDECQHGNLPPSLGAIAKLESALAIDWKIRFES